MNDTRSIGYPVATYAWRIVPNPLGFNLGGINASGQVGNLYPCIQLNTTFVFQVPTMGNFGLIDLDTPKDAHHRAGYLDGSNYVLVFSDEFNTDGRTFYPGDDPYWEAADLHYWVRRFPEGWEKSEYLTLN